MQSHLPGTRVDIRKPSRTSKEPLQAKNCRGSKMFIDAFVYPGEDIDMIR